MLVSFITSPSIEKGAPIARDMSTKEYVYVGKYKSGENELFGKFKPEYCTQRMVVYGKAGSGKTTYMSMIASSYHRQFPENDIILISPHDKEDEKAFKKQIKYIKQLQIDEDPEPIDPTKEFKDCLIIADDIAGFKTKSQNKFVHDLLRNVMYNCRKYGVSVIISTHELLSGNSTKAMNYESEQVTIFNQSRLAWRQIEHYATKYLAFDKTAVDKLKSMDSRWITIGVTNPNYILTETQCYAL